jgi:Holliday junction resolvase RusA-like endonuclease
MISPHLFPSPDGVTRLNVNVSPASSQSNSTRKNAVISMIRAITSQIGVILTGDVKIEIAWYINEDERYETDRSADTDNIIKPIVDALTGPSGIVVNDCQIQSVLCYWLDRFKIPEHIEIEMRYEPDVLFFKKDSLSFINIKKGLCLPIDTSLKPDGLRLFLDISEIQLHGKDELLSKGCNPSTARGVLPIQRIFHISRCHGFPIYTLSDLQKSIKP